MPDSHAAVGVSSISEEFEDAKLGDTRLSRRLVKFAEAVSGAPEKSFPRLAASESELEANYRFLANERVNWRAVMQPHREATLRRCEGRETVLAVHDTSEVRFQTDDEARKGLGILKGKGRGFLGHFALAISDEQLHTPLGVLGFRPLVRKKIAGSRKEFTLAQLNAHFLQLPSSEKESARWHELVEEVETLLEGRTTQAIHVMDREADSYMLWSRLVSDGRRFVIRGSFSRRKVVPLKRVVADELSEVKGQLLREVPLVHRPPRWKAGKKQPARTARLARLHFRAKTVTMKRPLTAPGAAESTTLNVVDVYELNPPEGEDAISWQLLTTEPIATLEQVEHIVDIYRARWTIEEYFKALKTGCAYEKRQLMSLHGLLNALALFIPIAWRILLLRTAARDSPAAPASDYLRADELALLRKLSVRVKLSSEPSVSECLLAIAGVGGHLKHNGPPGWQTIARGHEELSIGVRAIRLAGTLTM